MKKTLIFLALIMYFQLSAQTPVTQEERKEANGYLVAADWSKAIKSYQSISDREPQNWTARMRLGISQVSSGKNKEGIANLEAANKLGNNAQTMFALGSAYARDKQADLGFEWADKAVTAGFAQLNTYESDPGYTSLKGDARYVKIHDRLYQATYPCLFSDKVKEFEFWVGEWDVKNTLGGPAGKSKIEKMLSGCTILENWTSAPPANYSGKSINLYNTATNKWMQTWFDDKGAITEFINGEYKDNKMVLVTLPDAQNQITRLTFHNLGPDLVRQQFETTTDEGKTWSTTIDLYYNRVR